MAVPPHTTNTWPRLLMGIAVALLPAGCALGPGSSQPAAPPAAAEPAPQPVLDPFLAEVFETAAAGNTKEVLFLAPALAWQRPLDAAELQWLTDAAASAQRVESPEPGGEGTAETRESKEVNLRQGFWLLIRHHEGEDTLRWLDRQRFVVERSGRDGAAPSEPPVVYQQPDAGLVTELEGLLPWLPLSPEKAEGLIAGRARAVLTAIQDRDWEALAGLVHPEKGVRFSPYAYVDMEKDQLLGREALAAAETDATQRLWGYYDGSGEPIRLSFGEYVERFVWDLDFTQAPQVAYNRVLNTGNTLVNWLEAYPDSMLVEYHYPEVDPQWEGMDWRSLRLVFQEHAGEWYLVGVVHDQWTI